MFHLLTALGFVAAGMLVWAGLAEEASPGSDPEPKVGLLVIGFGTIGAVLVVRLGTLSTWMLYRSLKRSGAETVFLVRSSRELEHASQARSAFNHSRFPRWVAVTADDAKITVWGGSSEPRQLGAIWWDQVHGVRRITSARVELTLALENITLALRVPSITSLMPAPSSDVTAFVDRIDERASTP